MELVELEPGLHVYKCPLSHGHWIPESAYWRWVSHQPNRSEKLPPLEGHDVQEESGQPVRVCPETGKLMTRYKVGAGFSFRIDRSPNGGIWLDVGEWEALKSRKFHDELFFIFTNSWQKKIIKTEQLEALRRQFKARIGVEGYNRIAEFKTWMKEQEDGAAILCFLQDEEL